MTAAGATAEADALARQLCAKMGVAVDGPIGRRLLSTCRGAPAATLMAARLALGASGTHPDLRPFYDAATNRETYLFRDRRQLRGVERLLASRDPGLVTRLWSAGCATGEEAYSLAILAHRALPGAAVSVLGTDISASALEEAAAGAYRTGPLSACRDIAPDEALWLPASGDGARRTVAPAIRRLVRFAPHNLLDGPPGRERYDIVLCRNVILYMTEAGRRRALAVLAEATAPGGHLLLGTGDCSDPSIPVDAGFAPVEIEGVTLFRRTPT